MADEKNPEAARRRPGRKATGLKRVKFNVSCQPEERAELLRLAKEAGKTVSAFVMDATLNSRQQSAVSLLGRIRCILLGQDGIQDEPCD